MSDFSEFLDAAFSHQYELRFCEECIQMTNHLNGICQKHKKLSDFLAEEDED